MIKKRLLCVLWSVVVQFQFLYGIVGARAARDRGDDRSSARVLASAWVLWSCVLLLAVREIRAFFPAMRIAREKRK